MGVIVASKTWASIVVVVLYVTTIIHIVFDLEVTGDGPQFHLLIGQGFETCVVQPISVGCYADVAHVVTCSESPSIGLTTECQCHHIIIDSDFPILFINLDSLRCSAVALTLGSKCVKTVAFVCWCFCHNDIFIACHQLACVCHRFKYDAGAAAFCHSDGELCLAIFVFVVTPCCSDGGCPCTYGGDNSVFAYSCYVSIVTFK